MNLAQLRHTLLVGSIVGSSAFGSTAFPASQVPTSLPEGPAIWREVSGIENLGAGANYTKPHISPLRTTCDGRLAVNVKDVPRFTLLMPEKLTGSPDHFLHQPPGGTTMSFDHGSDPSAGYAGGDRGRANEIYLGGQHAIWNQVHSCLWDDGPPIGTPAGEDIYNLKVLVTAIAKNQDLNQLPNSLSIRFFVTPVAVTVAEAKTDAAFISAIIPGTTVAGPVYNQTVPIAKRFDGVAFEPTIVHDGRLIVFRIGSSNLPHPSGSGPAIGADIVYSFYTGGDTVDPTKWVDIFPISHAYHDQQLPSDLGFTRYPLRDAAGTVIPQDEDLGGTYPWMDREAKNLFFTTIGSKLHNSMGNSWDTGRYEIEEDPSFPAHQSGPEPGGLTRGVAFAGLWSRGKTVVIDNLNNDMDYAIGSTGVQTSTVAGPQQRIVKLYEDGAHSPAAPVPSAGKIRLGYGRANSTALPDGTRSNTTIIDSITNKLNYKKNVPPIGGRDVAWLLQNGKATDQLVFDEYTDPDAIIIAEMVGLTTFPTSYGGNGLNSMEYHDGWDTISPTDGAWGTPASHPIRLQNAATSHHRWELPPYGSLDHGFANNGGEGRLEPVASGGIHGRGLWLNDDIGLRFAMTGQDGLNDGPALDEQPVYVGLFVDPRFSSAPNATRRLLTFPDGSYVDLLGSSRIEFGDDTGTALLVDVPEPITSHTTAGLPTTFGFLEDRAWTHLAMQVSPGGGAFTVLLNGLPVGRWKHPTRKLFRLTEDDLVVGDPRDNSVSASFRGWIDEFKVILRELDPETACNLAGGTLMGLETEDSQSWRSQYANRIPEWSHASIDVALRSRGETSYGRYVCLHDYERDHPTFEATETAGLISLAEAMHFPEGPLFYDAPRPDTTTNQFCIGCHRSTEELGLGLDALAFPTDPSLVLNTMDDPRRQPLQPAALLHGFVPIDVIDAGQAAGPPTASSGPNPVSVDQWLLETRGTASSNAVNAFVVEADTGRPVLALERGQTPVLEPALVGAGPFTLQGFLDSAQGDVLTSWRAPAPTTGGASVSWFQTDHVASPYTAFKVPSNPFAGVNLAAGLHRFRVNPAGSTRKTFKFTVNTGTKRLVTSYEAGFQGESPSQGWFYGWNKNGPIAAPGEIATLHWDEDSWAQGSMYNELGMDWPTGGTLGYGGLHQDGGWPGQPAYASNPTRHTLAGFQFAADGFFSVENLAVDLVTSIPPTTADGLSVEIYVQSQSTWTSLGLGALIAPTASLNFTMSGSEQVSAGDVVWVAIGPRSNGAFDRFTLDYDIFFNETSY